MGLNINKEADREEAITEADGEGMLYLKSLFIVSYSNQLFAVKHAEKLPEMVTS